MHTLVQTKCVVQRLSFLFQKAHVKHQMIQTLIIFYVNHNIREHDRLIKQTSGI